MSVRTRTTLSLAMALGVLALAQPARAQSASLMPSAVTSPAAPADAPAAPAASAGPTLDAATVAVHHQADVSVNAPARRGGSAPGTALMIVGGAAILVGLVVGSPAGGAIAVGGAVVALIGLYQYLQ